MSLMLPRKKSQYSIDSGPCRLYFVDDKQCLFLRLSSSIGNQMCYVQLVASGFLSSSTHEIIQDAISHQWHFLCCQSIYLLHQFCWANHVHIPQVFKDCSQTLYIAILEFSILIFTECDRSKASVVWLAGRNPVESIYPWLLLLPMSKRVFWPSGQYSFHGYWLHLALQWNSTQSCHC